MEIGKEIKIAVLVPCYNEERTVGAVVDGFHRCLPEAEVYVYDNNSTDSTSDIAKSKGAIVKKVYQKGKGNVVRCMFSDVEADVYILVDGDDTYPAEYAESLITPILNGEADMVVGDRLSSTYFDENKRPFHNTGNVLVCKLINSLFKVRLNDILSGYRAFSKNFVKNTPVISTGFEIETELTINAIDNNLIIKEVPVAYRDRPDGSESKLNTFSDGARVLGMMLKLFRDYRPMLFFSAVSLVIAVISLVLLVPVFLDYFRTGLVERFPTLIFGCFMMLGSLMLFCAGLVLEVVKNQNRRIGSLIAKLRK